MADQAYTLMYGTLKKGYQVSFSDRFALTLPMLRLLPSKAQGLQTFFLKNNLNPIMLVFIGQLLLNNSHMSTHVPGFQSFFRIFASFCIGQISYQQHKGLKNTVHFPNGRPWPIVRNWFIMWQNLTRDGSQNVSVENPHRELVSQEEVVFVTLSCSFVWPSRLAGLITLLRPPFLLTKLISSPP